MKKQSFWCVVVLVFCLVQVGAGCVKKEIVREPCVEVTEPQKASQEETSKQQLQDTGDILRVLSQEPSDEDLVALGDTYFRHERSDLALIYSFIVARQDGGGSDAAYHQIAKILAHAESPDAQEQALHYLRIAIEKKGFWGYELLEDESVWEKFQDRPEFSDLLRKAKENHAAQASTHRASPLFTAPPKPASLNAPVLIGLHGYGSNAQDFGVVAQFAAGQGLFGISFPGTEVRYKNSYRWSLESVEKAHKEIQAYLKTLRDAQKIGTGPVYLTGFSQGGLHAAVLTLTYPTFYAGSMPISPGGQLGETSNSTSAIRPMFMIYGTEEHPGNISLSKALAKEVEDLGGKAKISTHGGQHHFPENWEEVFVEGLEFLRSNTP